MNLDLNSKEIREHAIEMRNKCVDTLDDNDVYIVHFFNIEILEKLDYVTEEKRWTEADREQIEKIKSKIGKAVNKVIEKELEKNPNSCLLEFISGLKDFKAEASLHLGKNRFHDLVDARLENIRRMLDK